MSKVYKLVICGIFICAFLYAIFIYFYDSRGYWTSKIVTYNEYSDVSFNDDCLVLYNNDTDKLDLCRPYYGGSNE